MPPAGNVTDMTFMVAGNAATSTPAMVQKTKPPMFPTTTATSTSDVKSSIGVNLFGTGTAAAQLPPPPPFANHVPQVADAQKPMPAALPAQPQRLAFGMQPAGSGGNAFGGGGVAGLVKTTAVAAVPAFGGPTTFGGGGNSSSGSTQPFLTVDATYSKPPTTPTAMNNNRTATATPQPSMVAGATNDDDKVIRRMIAEEVTAFEQDWARILARSQELRIDGIGNKDEMAATVKQLARLQDIGGQATESTDTLAAEIQSLRLALYETFAMVTEAQTKQAMFENIE